MSSQIRLRMVRGNAGGIVSSDMDAFVCGTYSPIYSSYAYNTTLVIILGNVDVDVYQYEM